MLRLWNFKIFLSRDKISIIDNRIKEFDKLGQLLNKGETIIKKSEFKYLTDKDFAGYVGVKFI